MHVRCPLTRFGRADFGLSPLLLIGLLALAIFPAALAGADLPIATQAVDAVAGSDGSGAAQVPVPEPSAQTERYYRSGNVLWVVATVWGLLVPAAIVLSGVSARLRDWAHALGRNWFFTIAVYVLLYLALVFLIDLPLNWYQGYVRPHAYGLSNQSLGQWFGDALKALAVTMVIAASVLWVPYRLLRRSPGRWWLWTGLAAVPFLVLMLLVQPVLIAPLFDDFGPMQDKALEAQILALAERAGIDGGRVFEVNKRADTDSVNAYVAGLFGTQRIVLWDTLLARLAPEQVLVVMGHEMGHFVLGHIWILLALLCTLVLATLYAVHRSLDFLIAGFGHRFGFSEPSDIASLPLLVLLFSAFFLLAQPIALAYSRHIEREADRFALEITRENRAMATAFTILQDQNLVHPRPGPLYTLWRARHPAIAERVEFANRYRPWDQGEPLVYGDRFQDAP
jgi:Zn-dependent protease with chaperone function